MSRNVVAGGDANVRGSVSVDHDLVVNGWLEANNIRGANKGLFSSEIQLMATYPQPQLGWYAMVGDTLPASLYIVTNGKWKATGTMAGTPILELRDCVRQKDLTALKADIEQNHRDIIETNSLLGDQNDMPTTHRTITRAVSAHESRLNNLRGQVVSFDEIVDFEADSWNDGSNDYVPDKVVFSTIHQSFLGYGIDDKGATCFYESWRGDEAYSPAPDNIYLTPDGKAYALDDAGEHLHRVGFTNAEAVALQNAPLALLADMWNQMWTIDGVQHGRHNPATGLFEGNSLSDISYRQALEIAAMFPRTRCEIADNLYFRYNTTIRTSPPLVVARNGGTRTINHMFFGCKAIEEIIFHVDSRRTHENIVYMCGISGLFHAFSGCSRLHTIKGLVLADGFNPSQWLNIASLVNLELWNLSVDINLSSARNLSVESAAFIVAHRHVDADSTMPHIAITVHDDVYQRIPADIRSEAAMKQVTFVTP